MNTNVKRLMMVLMVLATLAMASIACDDGGGGGGENDATATPLSVDAIVTAQSNPTNNADGIVNKLVCFNDPESPNCIPTATPMPTP